MSSERRETMKRWRRTVGKWILRGILLLLLLVALDVTALALPYPLFDNKYQSEGFSIYSSRALPEDVEEIVEWARARVDAMDYTQPDAGYRVFICGDERLYSVFAFLTRRSSNSLGIGLTVLGNMYLNESKIRRFAANLPGKIQHSRYEGNFSEVIAHEIAHFNAVGELGFWRAIRMPVWKSEGYAEYQANVAATRADDSYVFADRIDLLLNDAFWGSGASMARSLFEWHLLVEFLAEEKGFKLADLADEAVTETFAREEMLAWYDEQRSSR
jgi:hypothetical protein